MTHVHAESMRLYAELHGRALASFTAEGDSDGIL